MVIPGVSVTNPPPEAATVLVLFGWVGGGGAEKFENTMYHSPTGYRRLSGVALP